MSAAPSKISMNIRKIGDERVPVYEAELDEATRSASGIVVRSIAELTGKNLDDLEPLWDSVDPEALDSFVAHARECSTPFQFSFQYQGYTVEIAENSQFRFITEE